jgi:hypothetical protein
MMNTPVVEPVTQAKIYLDIAKETMPLYIDNAKSYAGLAAGALGLTIVFREKILGETGTVKKSFLLFSSWVCFLATIVTSAFYQWLAVRWIERRVENTYNIEDHRFPLDTVSAATVYGTMIAFLCLGGVILFYYSAQQLLSAQHQGATTLPTPASTKPVQKRYWLAGVFGLVVLTLIIWLATGPRQESPKSDPAAHEQHRQEQ